MAAKRIGQEHAYLQRDAVENCSAGPAKDDNLYRWNGSIAGPADTPYRNAVFSFTIDFPESYPQTAFRIAFTTPIFHPNVSTTGEVRLAKLEQNQWSPVFTVRSVLISLQAMLSDPNLTEGFMLNNEAANLYAQDRKRFERKAEQSGIPFAAQE